MPVKPRTQPEASPLGRTCPWWSGHNGRSGRKKFREQGGNHRRPSQLARWTGSPIAPNGDAQKIMKYMFSMVSCGDPTVQWPQWRIHYANSKFHKLNMSKECKLVRELPDSGVRKLPSNLLFRVPPIAASQAFQVKAWLDLTNCNLCGAFPPWFSLTLDVATLSIKKEKQGLGTS